MSSGDIVTVTPVPVPISRRAIDRQEDLVWNRIRAWKQAGIIRPGEWPIVYVEGYHTYDACAWSWEGRRGPYVAIPMASCEIYPRRGDVISDYGPYLLAHEVTHALGAAHTMDDPADIVFNGDWDEVDWDHLRLDPTVVEDSPLLEPLSPR